jgi:hypothetical protein
MRFAGRVEDTERFQTQKPARFIEIECDCHAGLTLQISVKSVFKRNPRSHADRRRTALRPECAPPRRHDSDAARRSGDYRERDERETVGVVAPAARQHLMPADYARRLVAVQFERNTRTA